MSEERRSRRMLHRAARSLLVTGVLVGAVGATGHLISWPLLTTSLGPTAYVFATHPHSETARLRNATIGHSVAIAVSLVVLYLSGLFWAGPIPSTTGPSVADVAVASLSVAFTVLLLDLLRSHHAPAAATSLLVSTRLAQPGLPLIGLIVGLAIVIALGPLAGRAALVNDSVLGGER